MSGRDLVRLNDAPKAHATELLALGDPDFDATVDVRRSVTARTALAAVPWQGYRSGSPFQSACSDSLLNRVPRLYGTDDEIQRLTRLWNGTSKDSAISLLRRQASEENFKALAPGKKVIHVSTHGFFESFDCFKERMGMNGAAASDVFEENPLLGSGLLLAGCNRRDELEDRTDVEDGILTAEEVSAMNLSGTKCVVLSACVSGLGEIKGGEGVYGLRRAFQLAGARSVVSSLWPISDQTAERFVSSLYSNFDKPLPVSMQIAATSYLRDMRKRGMSVHPFAWGAFISTGDWRTVN